jgi:hypothetical protein
MPKLPHLPRRPRPTGEAERLSRWFREWDLEQRLREEDPEYAEPMVSPPIENRSHFRNLAAQNLIAPFDTEVKVGQIRILHGGMFSEVRRPMHVAILSEWPPRETTSDEGVRQPLERSRNILPFSAGQSRFDEFSEETTGEKSYLIAPFGDYREPATTTEWFTGRDAGPLRVLCLWNTRDCPERWLELGWLVGEMSEKELANAWEVFRHAITGVPLSDRLRPEVGAPVIHPRDPRLAYQAEEARLFTIVPQYAEYRCQLEKNKIVWESEEIGLAAKSKSGTGSSLEFAKYSIGGTRFFLRILKQSDGKHVGINILDETSTLSVDLDGAHFPLRTGEPVRIVRGKAVCQQAALPMYPALLRPDGSPFELKRLE